MHTGHDQGFFLASYEFWSVILKQTKFITQDAESRLCVLTVYAVFTVNILFTLSFMITPRIVAMMIMRTVKQKAGLHQHRMHRKGNDNDKNDHNNNQQ